MNRTILKIKTDFFDDSTLFNIFECKCSSIDWGDGTFLASHNGNIEGNISHTYNNSFHPNREHIVTIYDNEYLKMCNENIDNEDYAIIEVIQISEMITDCSFMFNRCRNLLKVEQAKLPPNCTRCSHMFYHCSSLLHILSWGDVKELENCEYMYRHCSNIGVIKNMKIPVTKYSYAAFNCTTIITIENVILFNKVGGISQLTDMMLTASRYAIDINNLRVYLK